MPHKTPAWPPGTVVVDLTPILPGGENGGARIFVMELLRQLSALAPQTQFVLLTQAASHAQLAELDRPNVRRRMVVGAWVGEGVRPRLIALASRLLPYLPLWPRALLSRIGYGVNRLLKRIGSEGLLRDLGADLLFCPFTAPIYWEPGVPTLCVLYDLQYRLYPQFFAAEDIANRESTFQDACRRATLLTAISEYGRSSAIEAANLDPERVLSIPLRMAQRLTDDAPSGTPVLDGLGLRVGGYLLYPANFWLHKNHARLFEAFAIACGNGLPADLKLVCTGAPGERFDAVRALVAGFDVADRVCFPGYLPDSSLAELMVGAAGLVFPSLYEGFGLPVIEAMASGIPVACSNCTALPEVADDAAILFDPTATNEMAQAILTLVLNDERRAALVKAGYARALHYANTSVMAEQYWEAFRTAIHSYGESAC